MAALVIDIAGTEYRGRLPHMTQRFALWLDWRRALGFRDGDEAGKPSAKADGTDMTHVALAAVGLCWDDEPLDVPSFRVVRRRMTAKGEEADALVEFGECVYDALSQHHAPQALYDAGTALIDAAYESIPTDSEVEESTNPTPALAEGST